MAWLAQAPEEPVLEPELAIVDTHHHLWDHAARYRYLLPEFLEDVATGLNVIETVFVQCHAMYRAKGPAEMRPVGETEFVAGIAAMSASGIYGKTQVAAGIVGFADLTLGDRLDDVLDTYIRAGGGRFRGVRHSGAWDADPDHRQRCERYGALSLARFQRWVGSTGGTWPLARRLSLSHATR